MSNRFREAVESGEFVVTVEMVPGRGANEETQQQEVRFMREIWETGLVHAISVTDNPSGNPAIMADAVSRLLASSGVCALTHLSCKDRTRNQIQSQLYAMQRDGLENLLLMTGDCQRSGWQGAARPVFDLDSVHLQMLTSQMNEGLVVETRAGENREVSSNFFCGACVNPFKYRTGEIVPQYLKAEKKILAGAQFLITQLGYDTRKIHELKLYLEERGYDTPVIANVFLLTKGSAQMMREGKIAGCYVNAELMDVVTKESQLPDKGRSARVERAAKQVAIARGLGFAGVHIGGFGLDAVGIASVLSRAEQLSEDWQECAAELSYGRDDGDYLYPVDPRNPGLNQCGIKAIEPKENTKGRKLFRNYRLSRIFHYWVFDLDKRFNKLLARVMDWRERKKGLNRNHGIEHACKSFLYGCVDCGDCGLEACAYTCPMAQCPKSQRNGPCGGSMNGWCEKYPGEKYCIWYKAYHRLDACGEQWRMRTFSTLPNDWELWRTSSWSNYTHKRDNAAKRIPVDIGLR